MSGGVPVSINITPDTVAPGQSTTVIVTLDEAPTSQPQNVPLQYLEIPNDSKDTLLLSPPPAVTVLTGSLAGKTSLYTAGGTAGGIVVVIAGTGLGAVADTLTIT